LAQNASYTGVGFRNVSLVGFNGGYYGTSGQQDNNPSDYTAYINWGDGKTSVVKGGTVTMGPDGPQTIVLDKDLNGSPKSVDGYPLDVKASHVYQNPTSSQPYSVTVQIQGPDGRMSYQASAGSEAVSNLPNPHSLPGMPSPQEPTTKPPSYLTLGIGGRSGSGGTQTGSLIQNLWLGNVNGSYDGTLDPAAGDYHVQFNWGDNNKWYEGTVKPNTQGNGYSLELDGTYKYQTPGTYTIVACITGPDGTTQTQEVWTLNVSGNAIKPDTLIYNPAPQQGPLVSGSQPRTQVTLAAASPAAASSLAQQGGTLFLGGHAPTPAQYRALVAPGGVVDPLRLQIFNAMNHNPRQQYHFATLHDAQQNFDLRVDIIQFMNVVARDDRTYPGPHNLTVNGSRLDFGYSAGVDDETANRDYWKILRASGEFVYYGRDSYDAILSIAKTPYRGECLGAAQIAILYATAEVLGKQVLGKQQFNQRFPQGLDFGFDPSGLPTSAQYLYAKQLKYQNPSNISTQGMVPGDLVYMHNLSKYSGGPYTGENAIYMGNYDLISSGLPVYRAGATPRFSGLGLYDQSAAQLQQDLWAGYCQDVLHRPPDLYSPIREPGIGWSIDISLGTTSY
jgi:hypothetical protein